MIATLQRSIPPSITATRPEDPSAGLQCTLSPFVENHQSSFCGILTPDMVMLLPNDLRTAVYALQLVFAAERLERCGNSVFHI